METIPLEDRCAIEKLLSDFCWLVDHGEADKVTDLFIEQGKIITPMFILTGKDEISHQFEERQKDKNRVSRHSWSNLRVENLNHGRVRVMTGVQTYMANGEMPIVPQNFIIGDSIDVVIKGDDGIWLFEERRLVVAFKGE